MSCAAGPLIFGKLLPQRGNDVAGLVQAQRGLGQIGDPGGIGHGHRGDFRRRTDDLRHRRSLSQRADHLIVIAVANQDQRIAFPGELHCLDVDLGDQRAGGVNDAKLPQLAVLAHFGRHAVGAVDNPLTLGNFVHVVHENGALVLQFLDDEAVVDDLLAHVDRRAEGLQRDPDNINGPHHPGAESARLQ